MYETLYKIYDNFKLDFYHRLYSEEEASEDKLTVSESFCLEVISSLKDATVKDVAEFMRISQPNAAFKISNLEDKGYIKKVQSTKDRRKFYLRETDKYYIYRKHKNDYIKEVMDRLEENLTEEEKEKFNCFMEQILECMPEYNKVTRNKEELSKIIE